jgi:ATP-GRASP peptide maturase of grasp-with-spasm system
MILIISSNDDQSSCDVMKWLSYYNDRFFVVTDQDNFEIIDLSPSGKFTIKIKNRIINSQEINSVWYRRGGLKLPIVQFKPFNKTHNIFYGFQAFCDFEKNGLCNFLNYCLLDIKGINNYLFSHVNKLMILKSAENVGLAIPETIVTSHKSVLMDFIKHHKKVITKPAIEGLFFKDKNDNYCFTVYTELVTDELLSKYGDTFASSLFQVCIPKIFEIRIFYLEKEFYSMAIFSQNNMQTTIDFRHYDKKLPNRNVPFQLPFEIEEKIIELMKRVKINSASIDMIYGTDKKFYFLEINPIGQFGMTSYPCNYYLERRIANQLKNV